MYVCTNCGAEHEELYRRYCPSVLKLLKCGKCGELADKYVEYDRAIILVDLILLEKQAYRHLLYNSEVTSYWKIIIVLWLVEAIQRFYNCDSEGQRPTAVDRIFGPDHGGTCNFYVLLSETAFSMAAFVLSVVMATEIKRGLTPDYSTGYSVRNLTRALIIGGCTKILGLLGIVWKHIAYGPHYTLVRAYTVLCLLTSYSIVCNSGKLSSLFMLSVGFLAYNLATSFHATTFVESIEF